MILGFMSHENGGQVKMKLFLKVQTELKNYTLCSVLFICTYVATCQHHSCVIIVFFVFSELEGLVNCNSNN